MVGLPARSPSAVVPAPPWCPTADIFGNSHSCGAESITHTPSGRLGGTLHPPVASTPRCSVCLRAVNVAATTLSEVHPLRLPKPTNTGGGPPWGKSARRAGGCQSCEPSRNQYPVTVVESSQSTGGTTTRGLQQTSFWTGRPQR